MYLSKTLEHEHEYINSYKQETVNYAYSTRRLLRQRTSFSDSKLGHFLPGCGGPISTMAEQHAWKIET